MFHVYKNTCASQKHTNTHPYIYKYTHIYVHKDTHIQVFAYMYPKVAWMNLLGICQRILLSHFFTIFFPFWKRLENPFLWILCKALGDSCFTLLQTIHFFSIYDIFVPSYEMWPYREICCWCRLSETKIARGKARIHNKVMEVFPAVPVLVYVTPCIRIYSCTYILYVKTIF